ncbi:MAG: ankyrin repeat domain-containing protein, partial [Legionellaceae bacterium]|nr:ankyrin repeat domain-containing protein [Legionellaceae bacterium]
MTAELKKLIDEQNLEALQEYLDLHPHLDLDHVTDTGLSALWWAIYPPQDKIVSQEIIQCLIDKRVDPTQRMYGQGIDKSLSDVSVSILLRNYANREYIHSTKKNTQELQNIAQDSQNTHNSLVVQQFNDFISNLYQRYVLTKKTNLSWDDNFDVFAKKHNSSPILQKAINRIQADTGGYPLEGQDKSLSNAELLMLVWYALNDTDTAHYVTGCSMSVEDQTKRKVDLLNFLVEAQTAYGKNNPACFMGTRHKIISTLDKIHIDCEGSTQKLSKEKFQELYDIFCAEAITVLQTENPSLYASFAATYAPTTQEIPADVLVFVDATKKNFKKSIEEHQHSLLDSHKMPADIFEPLKTLYTSEDIPLSVTMHPVVSKVTRFWDQEPQLRKIGALQKEVPLCPTIDVLHTASGFQDWVKTHYSEDKSSVLAYLNSEPLCQKFLSATPAAEKITETLWQDILSVSLANTEIDLSQQFPLAVLHPYLSEHWKAQLDDKKLLEWLNCLSNESKVAFYQALYATENPDIAAIAFHIAQEQGFWSHFPLQQEIIFKDKDLRGMDFRTLDLSHCTFENCDLRMTGILENPTLKSQHLDTSIIEIPIEKSLGFFAVYYSCIGAMNVFLEKFPEYIKNQSIHGNTILHIASRLERHEMTLAILEKNSSSEFVQMENDCGSTALHRAASSGRTEVVTAILNKNSSLEFLQM